MFEGSGGTAEGAATPEAGSQPEVVVGAEGVGAEGKEPEPTVEVDGQQVPVSKVKNALKVESEFTPRAQELAAREKEIAERERVISEREVASRGLGHMSDLMANPDVAQRIVEAVPEMAEAIPSPSQIVDSRLLAENLSLKFDAFAIMHPEFEQTELVGIRQEMYELAKAGKFDEALDFETIGYRLYKDEIVERAKQTAIAEHRKQEAQQRQAGTPGAGVAPIPRGVDPNKMPPEWKLSMGHARASQK